MPPSRGEKPPQSRLAEFDTVKVPTLVIQGERDQFGIPPPGPARVVVKVPGDHGLKADLAAVAAALQEWFRTVALPAATA